MERSRHPLTALAAVVAVTLPWVLLRLTGLATALPTGLTILTSGVAVLGAAFVLTWAAETAEKDVPRAFALAVLAIIAVAPEYAVDALYAWEAGAFAGTPRGVEAANLAVANMTGANRILIGLGWSGIALYAIYRTTRSRDPDVTPRDGFLADRVELDPRISIEILFLAVATAYAFLIPLGGGIGALDALFLVGLYATYIVILLRGDAGEEVHLGVPGFFHKLPRRRRIASILAMFAYAAIVILIAVKPFARGLETMGPRLGLSAFFMIQWVAPLASESPEFIATAYLVRKARTTSAFNTLISSKLNQWTLLIGTLVVVYSISLGAYDTLSFSPKQAGEIWLTAAQSFFAVTLILDLTMSTREALGLLALFLIQFYPPLQQTAGLLLFTGVYVALGLALLIKRRRHVPRIASLVKEHAAGEGSPDIPPPEHP